MSLVLNLSAELESELETEAAKLGIPLSDYALRLIAAGRATRSEIRTGADLVRYWQRQGLIGCRPDISDSQAHARALREQAERRPQG